MSKDNFKINKAALNKLVENMSLTVVWDTLLTDEDKVASYRKQLDDHYGKAGHSFTDEYILETIKATEANGETSAEVK